VDLHSLITVMHCLRNAIWAEQTRSL